MCHDLIHSANFFELIFNIDQDVAKSSRELGCFFCGGPLHKSNYQRKPRGFDLIRNHPSWCTRFSYCCGNDGCRKRHTPPSLRFLSAHTYLSFVIVLACALQQGLTPQREAKLLQHIPKQTLYRWLAWWRNVFGQSGTWKDLKGYLDVNGPLPYALLKALVGENLTKKLLILLKHLCQVTSKWALSLMEVNNPQDL